MLMAVCHSSKTGWIRVDDLERLSDLREEGGNLLWAEADASELTDADMDTIAEEFGLHHLAKEDAIKPRQRPKAEDYASHRFVVLHQLDLQDGQLEPVQLACFVGERYVLTIHHGATRTLEAAKERWRKEHDGDLDDPSRLIHTLIDVIVDEYQVYADDLEQEVEDLEEIALDRGRSFVTKNIYELYKIKQRVSRIRRFALPVGRMLDELGRMDLHETFLPEQTKHLFRDVKDHTERIASQLMTADSLSQAVLDLVRNQQADQLNENNRKLSAWAAIFAIGTLIAGVYGMNFRLVPDDGTLFGFWFAVVLMVASSGAMFLYFKKKGWL